MALLHVDRGENKGQIIPLEKERIVLGRSPDCDAVISKNEAVSRWHAQIVRIDQRYLIEDLESRNKTFVNDKEVKIGTQVQLTHKDCIRICKFQATFLDASAQESSDDSASTVEATLSSKSDHRLETQPAAKLAVLLEISARLSKTLQLDAQLPEVADGLLRLFPQADRCFLILAEEESEGLETKVVRTRKPADAGVRFSNSIVRKCLETGQAILWREGEHDTPTSDSVLNSQIRSFMCVPLCPAEGQPFGVIQIDTLDGARKFTEDDLRLLWGVSHQAAAAMQSALYHELRVVQVRVKNELEMARQVQRNFLPRQLPALPGYEFFTYYEAAREIGGDYYDFIPLPGERLAVTIGDVAGKGMPAALLMARLSSEARSCFLTEREPTAAVSKLNRQLYPITHTDSMDRFVSLATAVLDPKAHAVTLVNAGHPMPLLYRRAERKISRIPAGDGAGTLLGISESWNATSSQVMLAAGDCLILYSDGVTDAQGAAGKAFRTAGICSVVDKDAPDSPGALGERIVKAVQQHSLGGAQNDDVTLICFGRPAASGDLGSENS